MWICPNCKTHNHGSSCRSCGYVYQHSKLIDPDPSEGVILNTTSNKGGKKRKKSKNRVKPLPLPANDVILNTSSRKKRISPFIKIAVAVLVIYFIGTGIIIFYHWMHNGDNLPQEEHLPQNDGLSAENLLFPNKDGKETENPQDNQQLSDTNDIDDLDTDTPSDQTQTEDIPEGEDMPSEENNQVFIGINEYGEVTSENSEKYGIPRGVMILNVAEKSPAYYAGLKYGDVVISYNGTRVLYADDILFLKDGGNVGDKAQLTIFRLDHGEFDVTITLEKY